MLGLFQVEMTLTKPGEDDSLSVMAEVGSRATFSVVPDAWLRRAGFAPTKTAPFELPDGSVVERGLTEFVTAIDGRSGLSPVVFGDDDMPCLVGLVTLGRLLLKVDDEGRRLVPFHPRLPIDRPRPILDEEWLKRLFPS